MGCQNPIDLLPKELLEQIQKYVDGKTIYIPKKSENRKHWGDNTDTKQLLASRNCRICSDYQSGMDNQIGRASCRERVSKSV